MDSQLVTPSTLTILSPTKLSRTRRSTSVAVSVKTAEGLESEPLPRGKESILREKISSSTLDTDVEGQDYEIKGKWYSNIRYTYLNTYRRLFSIVFGTNLIGYIFVWIYCKSVLNFVNGAAVNLLISGLARQPLFVNFLYATATRVPRSAPLRLRVLAAKIFHFGGVHSGCGVACAVWYITFVGYFTHEIVHRKIPLSPGMITVLVLTYLVMVLLCSIVVVAHPSIRAKSHDWFEGIHRFNGWLAIAMFWPLLVTFAAEQRGSTGRWLIHQPTFWILIIITAAVIHPWSLLRKVKVVPEKLSDHAVRLHFNFTTTKFGQGLSISKHPLRDWHSFASFPDRFDQTDSKFSMVISRAGDFTGDLIDNPPEKIWKRSVPAYGFGKCFGLFNRIVLVTTGSGIGPCLSFIADDNRPQMRVIWQTRDPQKTYGDRLINLVRQMDPDPVITRSMRGPDGKRIDMLPQVLRLYREFEAEAVCVISNPQYTKHLVFELERRGIIAMGPIFDS